MLHFSRLRHAILYRLISIFVVSLLIGCSSVSDEEVIAARKAVKEGALLIDVRTPSEYKDGHIKGAHNIPLQILGKVYMHLPQEKEIVVYCRAGNRSEVAAEFLREQGWKVHDVGTQENWEREIK